MPRPLAARSAAAAAALLIAPALALSGCGGAPADGTTAAPIDPAKAQAQSAAIQSAAAGRKSAPKAGPAGSNGSESSRSARRARAGS